MNRKTREKRPKLRSRAMRGQLQKSGIKNERSLFRIVAKMAILLEFCLFDFFDQNGVKTIT